MNRSRHHASEFIRDLRAQKLRTFLTVFGIVWGTVAIVVLLAFGMGFKRQLAINMHGIGESIAIMFPGRRRRPFDGFGIGRPIQLTEDDATLLATQVPEITGHQPGVQFARNAGAPGREHRQLARRGDLSRLRRDEEHHPRAPAGGSSTTWTSRQRRRVVVLGDEVKEHALRRERGDREGHHDRGGAVHGRRRDAQEDPELVVQPPRQGPRLHPGERRSPPSTASATSTTSSTVRTTPRGRRKSTRRSGRCSRSGTRSTRGQGRHLDLGHRRSSTNFSSISSSPSTSSSA